jgi:hypothetical protein
MQPPSVRSFLFLLLALAGCGSAAARAPETAMQAATEAHATAAADAPGSTPAPAPAMVPTPGTTSAAPDAAARSAIGSVVGSSARSANEPATANNRQPEGPAAMLIYTAAVGMTADEDRVASTIDAVIDVAYQLGGYVATRNDTSVTVRIPSAQFRAGLRQVEGLGEVTSRSVSTEDVSEQFHDLEVRLANLRALRQRLETFFSRANSIQEALQVQTELERVAREIDQIEGRMRFLASRAAFSMVTVSVTARPRPQPVQVQGPSLPPPPTPVRRIVQVPIEWLGRLGVGRLLDLATP